MPDANGRFKGIAVPELPWLRDKTPRKPPGLKNGQANRDTKATLS